MSSVATRKTTNRKKTAGSSAGGNVLRRKKWLKAREERPTDKRPGPRPPKRLLTVTARRKHDAGASMGQAIASAAPQEIVARL